MYHTSALAKEKIVRIRSMLRSAQWAVIGHRHDWDKSEKRVAASGALAIGIATLVFQLMLGTTVADYVLGSLVAWLHPVAWIVGAVCVAGLAIGMYWLIRGISNLVDWIDYRFRLRKYAHRQSKK